MKAAKILACITLFTLGRARAEFCQLNIRGDSICIDDIALFQPAEKAPAEREKEETKQMVIRVKDINYPDVVITQERGFKHASIDELYASLECLDSMRVCRNDRIQLDSKCTYFSARTAVVSEVFSNDTFLIHIKDVPALGDHKSFLLQENCVEKVLRRY